MSLEKNPPLDVQNVEAAVEIFNQDRNTEIVIAYLRAHKEDVSEFYLQLRDYYRDKDSTTPFLLIAQILEKLL